MSISSRIEETIESWSAKWRDRLRGWMISWTFGGIVDALETMTPDEVTSLNDLLQIFIDEPNTPPELQAFLRGMPKKGNPLIVLGIVVVAMLMFIPMVTGAFQPVGNLWNQQQERKLRSFRLDPLSIITAWRRDPEKYKQYFDDLIDQGWSDERIEALKFFTQFYPSAQDLVNWLAKEVFEPDARSKYGLDDEADLIDFSLFAGAGVSEEQALNYWRAHWEHPSFLQMMELLHRGLLTASGEVPAEPQTPAEWETRDRQGTEEMFEWYRLVEVPPHWRHMLTESLWNVPTRVDVRRWWDMRVISEQELYSIYHRQGYRGKDLDNYILWTKVYTDFPVLLARWTNGWITEDDVRQRLLQLGMPADRVEEMIQEKIKPEESARVEEGRKLTKSEIYKGVKKGLITSEEGIELIMDLGHNRAEAEYLMTINVEVLAGSPETFAEFKDLTQKWRLAVGKEAKPITEELKQAGKEVARLTADEANLRRQMEDFRGEIIGIDPMPEEIVLRQTELEATLANAERALALARSSYNDLVAQWRHKEG